MNLLKINYPFDPIFKHHLLIALSLAIWIFVFLYFTEPLDINEFSDSEKSIYLPAYGVLGSLLYIISLPVQYLLYNRFQKKWSILSEVVFLILFIIISIIGLRLFYLYVVVPNERNPYTFSYHLKSIIFPALITILPIVVIGRFGFGKYKQKKLEAQKIEIKGEGNYDCLKLLLDELICIQSSDNYIEVFYISGTALKKSLIRNKLSVIADEFPELLRTHRSFIINPFHFQSWKTEKGKISVVLSYDIEVPISKTYQDVVKSELNSTTK
ncbi:MAG: transcriptional regulator [Lutibacter sp.]|nr:MAG: transcriptional regulator [Lutibacter sp.]